MTSDELVDARCAPSTPASPPSTAFRVVLTQQALADAAAADRKRAAGRTTSAARHPDRRQGRRRRRGRAHQVRHSGQRRPATADSEVVRRLRAAGAVIVGKTNTCELGQWPFTSGPAFGHTRNPWSREHTPGRLVGRQRRRGGRRAGDRGDRLRRRGQRPDPRGVDASRRHQAAARADLHLAAARGVQRHHRQRRAGPHRHRRRAGARRRVRQRRRRSAQAAAGAGVGLRRPRARPADSRDVDQVPVSPCSGPSCIPRSAPRWRPSPVSSRNSATPITRRRPRLRPADVVELPVPVDVGPAGLGATGSAPASPSTSAPWPTCGWGGCCRRSVLRKARAARGRAPAPRRLDLQPRRRRSGADDRAAAAAGPRLRPTAAAWPPTAR